MKKENKNCLLAVQSNVSYPTGVNATDLLLNVSFSLFVPTMQKILLYMQHSHCAVPGKKICDGNATCLNKEVIDICVKKSLRL